MTAGFHTQRQLMTALAAAHGVPIGDPLDPAPPGYGGLPEVVGCRRCRDVGWLSRGVGPRVECPCGLIVQRRLEKLFPGSAIKPRMRKWTLESYAALSGRHELVRAIRRVWDHTASSLLLTGPVGVGKSGIAISLLNERHRRSEGGLFVVSPRLLSRLRDSYSKDASATEEEIMDLLIQTPLLVLDDLGKVKLTEWGQEKLFTLISERYEAERRMIVSSNLTLDQLEEHLDAATFDRLRGMSEVFEISGSSLR